MADDRALQKNAADPKQRAFAARAEKRREERRASMYRAALNTQAGRFVLADIIVKSGVFKSPWNPHGGVQSCNIGRMEVGLELNEFLKRLDLALQRTMWIEWEALEERDNRETDAAHTAQASAAVETEGDVQ
jgi:hypothetical protein